MRKIRYTSPKTMLDNRPSSLLVRKHTAVRNALVFQSENVGGTQIYIVLDETQVRTLRDQLDEAIAVFDAHAAEAGKIEVLP